MSHDVQDTVAEETRAERDRSKLKLSVELINHLLHIFVFPKNEQVVDDLGNQDSLNAIV